MYAIILAGGQGTRLKPYTNDQQKSMVKIAGKPIIEHQILHLKEAGVHDIIITEHHKKEVIQDYLGDGTALGIRIHHLEQSDETLGSCGSIKAALNNVPEDEISVLIVYGDILTDIDFRELINHHNEAGQPVTIYLAKEKVPLGVAVLDESGIIKGFVEKPTLTVNTGICIVQREVKDTLPSQGDFFPTIGELFANRISGYVSERQWWHITNEGDLKQADKEFRFKMYESENHTSGERQL